MKIKQKHKWDENLLVTLKKKPKRIFLEKKEIKRSVSKEVTKIQCTLLVLEAQDSLRNKF